jgi:hypothetical protein
MIEAHLHDGTVLHFPDNTDPEVVQKTVKNLMAQETPYPPQPQPESRVSRTRAFVEGAKQGATLGAYDEGMAGATALVGSALSDMSFDDIYKPSIEQLRADYAEARNEHPGYTMAGEAAGGVASSLTAGGILAKAAPKVAGALVSAAKTSPYISSAGYGAATGGLYGFNTAEGPASERMLPALAGAGIGAIAGPVVTALGRKVVAPLASKAGDYLKRGYNALTESTGYTPIDRQALLEAGRSAVTPENVTLEAGSGGPLTLGQRTQNVNQLAAEDQALRMGNPTAIAARSAQQDAIRKPFQVLGADTSDELSAASTGATPDEYAGKVAGVIRNTYDKMKGMAQAAYKKADELGDLTFKPEAINQNFIEKTKSQLLENGVEAEDFPGLFKELDRLTKKMTGEDGTSVSGIKIRALEEFKKRLNMVNPAGAGISEDAARRLLKITGQNYDQMLSELGQDAILSGDEKAIKAFFDARGIASKYLNMQNDDFIGKIIQERDMTNKELANWLYGSARGGRADAGRVLSTALNSIEDDTIRETMRVNARNGLLAKALGSGFTKDLDPGFERVLLSPTNIRKELIGQIRNKSLFETAYSPQEQEAIKNYAAYLGRIASNQVGAQNVSNSAIMIFRGMEKFLKAPGVNLIPGTSSLGNVMGSQAQTHVERMGERGAREALQQLQKQLTGAPVYYGGVLGGMATGRVSSDVMNSTGAQ